MRKIFIAAMAATVALASCNLKENTDMVEKVELTVKISGVNKTKSVEPEAEANQIVLTNGYIFVFNVNESKIIKEPLNVEAATGIGQTLGVNVSSDSYVFIIGNIPPGSGIENISSIYEISDIIMSIETQTDYKRVLLFNSNGDVAEITKNNGKYEANVTISPIISRFELVQVEGGSDESGTVTAFSVTGVFLDNYYALFNCIGQPVGTKFSQGTSTSFFGIGDAPGPWVATGTNPPIAVAGSGNVWAYNVVAYTNPRLLIRLNNISYKLATGEENHLGNNEFFLTVSIQNRISYLEKGKIYRIGTTSNPLTFTPRNMCNIPNQKDMQIPVNITVEDWQIVTPDIEIL